MTLIDIAYELINENGADGADPSRLVDLIWGEYGAVTDPSDIDPQDVGPLLDAASA